ncbi:acyl-CoA dehydrogenase family protein [Maribius pontilimi]|uniref:Acyl-CoA dehydrogenase family protein n=1 Tax=Palleronia pontilimi TaxID=1964209 RepID=A0A934MIE5_9RHOB|nr:acyl-CoA dehydrogenase family protein [Palleronia pontilimi]MBJ3764179.1 acyl-CoA dehydrogenase family protein [Palleronia pontilimi]
MKFDLTEERQMLQDGLRRFMRDSWDKSTREAVLDGDTGYSSEAWQGLAEMGVIGALFTEDDGGFGGAGFDLSVVFEELGRAGATEPLLEVVLAGGLIARRGSDDQKAVLESVIAGETQLAFAHTEPASRYDLDRVSTEATKSGDGFTLSGRKAVVVNGPNADHIVVSARTSGEVADRDGISLFVVKKGAEGMDLRGYRTMAGSHAAEIALDNVQAELLGSEGDAFDDIEWAVARATGALSAEALGLMEACRKLTADYLKQRTQFGKPIGKFQALQFRMADVLIEIEQARSAVINLCGNLDQPRDLRERHVSATKQLIGAVAKLVVEESIQMHGGIGMTEEYDLAHLTRRLTMCDHRLGDTTYHLSRFTRLAAA